MKKVFTVYVSPLEMESTAHRLVDLPMEQEKLDTLILELNTGQPLYTEVSDYCGRDYLVDHMPEDMDLTELNLLAEKLASLEPVQEAALEGLVRMDLDTQDKDGHPIEERHIVSVFKLVQELLVPSQIKGKNQYQLLMDKLPENHKAKMLAGSALTTSDQAMKSVISTVLSRLNAFLDSEMEQILCFDTAIDAEIFCNQKSAIFIVLPEEDQTKYFMVSLILQNLYREILTVADENGGRLKNRVVFFADELGTCPPIQSLELMFSASRSRGLMLVPIVQSITGQLQKNYGREGSEIIVDNCQVNIFGGFAPSSQTAVEVSKALGS